MSMDSSSEILPLILMKGEYDHPHLFISWCLSSLLADNSNYILLEEPMWTKAPASNGLFDPETKGLFWSASEGLFQLSSFSSLTSFGSIISQAPTDQMYVWKDVDSF